MMDGWKKTRLGKIIKLEYGKPLSKEKRISNGCYPVYGANGVIARTNEFFFDRPSIIVGRKGSAGEINLSESKFWPLDVTYYVTFDDQNFDRLFIYYLLRTLDIKSYAKGVKPGINRNDVYSLEVSYPSIAEQRRIVAKLDEAFAAIDKAIENTRKNLLNARELFKSYRKIIFNNSNDDWFVNTLGEIIKLEYGKPLPKEKRRKDGLYPVFGANGPISRTNEYYYDKPSIIVGRKGSTGEVNLTPQKFWPLDVTYFVTFDNKKLNLLFIFHLLKVLNLQRLSKGVKPGINRNEVYSLEVRYPPLIEQRNIVEKLHILSNEIDKLIQIYMRKLTDLEELKQSLLNKAFSEEL